MSVVKVSELGLAAYLRIKGVSMVSFDKVTSSYHFDSDRTLDEWRVEYMGTECYQHDKEVMSLRQFKSR